MKTPAREPLRIPHSLAEFVMCQVNNTIHKLLKIQGYYYYHSVSGVLECDFRLPGCTVGSAQISAKNGYSFIQFSK